MQVRIHDDPGALLAAADPFFRADPFSANVIAVHAARLAADSWSAAHNRVADEAGTAHYDRLWATIDDADGSVVGVAMHTPPHRLFLSRMPDEAARALADTLADGRRDLPGVNGAQDPTAAFAAAWTARTGRASTLLRAMRMYRLGELRPPAEVPGEAALATAPADVGLVAGWMVAFREEADPHAPPGDGWTIFAERRIADGQIHLWRDRGTAVSVAGVSPAAAGVARVGPVYTPPSERRRGYGAAVTAAATAAALADGAEHVALYTDLANPTSNSIYQAIGYVPDHDAQELAFD